MTTFQYLALRLGLLLDRLPSLPRRRKPRYSPSIVITGDLHVAAETLERVLARTAHRGARA